MVHLLVVLLIIYPVRCYLRNKSHIPDLEDRIYIGYEVDIKQYPHAVFLHFESKSPSSCGGNLIFSQIVLTAAHCVDELRHKQGKISAFFGANYPTKALAVRKVIDFEINPNYNEKTGKNNLGLAFLDNPVPLQNEIKKIPLAVEEPEAGTQVFSAGWGKQKVHDNNRLSDISSFRHLAATKQRIASQSECIEYSGLKMSGGLLCTLPLIGHFHKDDSGDGLVLKSKGLLVGVLSFVADGVSMHTGVSSHVLWIRDNCYKLFQRNCKTKVKG